MMDKNNSRSTKKFGVAMFYHRPSRVVSGGQTGADRGGLEAGKLLGLETGGWAAPRFMTEEGPKPELSSLGLVEIDVSSGTSMSEAYAIRTYMNVKDSQATVVFGNANSVGSRLTLKHARALGRPHHTVAFPPKDMHPQDTAMAARLEGARLQAFCARNNVVVLNVAGNRETVNPGIFAFTGNTVYSAFRDPLRALSMSAENVKKIMDGTKVTTLRAASHPSGVYTIGKNGELIYLWPRGHLTVEEAGGVTQMTKSEDFGPKGPMFKQTAKWLAGEGRLFVYDITPV